MHHSDPKQFGYYSVGNNHVFSKIEALELSERLNLPIRYHFNDEVFSACDWKNEPSNTLESLYIQRVQQIKLKYDYIVLFYSGGADSHNMLEAFLHAGVYPDEIASFHSFGGDRDKSSTFNKEVFETAIPYVKQLKESGRLPKSTAHRLIDMSDIIVDFSKQINWHEFGYYVNSSISVNNVARAFLRKHIKHWSDLISKGKKLVLLWGHDKPRVNQCHDNFYLEFLDIQDNCVSVINQQTPVSGYYDELFYNTPDLPEILIKQAHIIKKFLESVGPNHPYLTTKITGLGHIMKTVNSTKTPHWLTQNGLSYLIYPWFNDKLYYEGKPKDIITSKRDAWFWRDNELSANFHATINSLAVIHKTKWLNFNDGNRWTTNFRSKKYLVG